MVGWHHQLNGHEFEEAPGVGDGQRSLACCSPWGCKELDMPENRLLKPVIQQNAEEEVEIECVSAAHLCKLHQLGGKGSDFNAIRGQVGSS